MRKEKPVEQCTSNVDESIISTRQTSGPLAHLEMKSSENFSRGDIENFSKGNIESFPLGDNEIFPKGSLENFAKENVDNVEKRFFQNSVKNEPIETHATSQHTKDQNGTCLVDDAPIDQNSLGKQPSAQASPKKTHEETKRYKLITFEVSKILNPDFLAIVDHIHIIEVLMINVISMKSSFFSDNFLLKILSIL